MKGNVKKITKDKSDKKKFIIILCLIIVAIIGICIILKIFIKNPAKNLKIGNNSTSQEIVDYILNICYYEDKIEVNVRSNKNENKYVIKQIYNGPNSNMQEVLEPSNIAGVKIIKEGKSLKLENSDLNLISMYENYQYISDNSLDLCSFIEDYKNNEKSNLEEKENQIILKTSTKNQPSQNKILYISKQTKLPEKMEVQDTNKNIAVYILYNEVKVNS